MKVFSNFDTRLRQKKFLEYQQEYWVDNVLCFGRSKLYRWIKVFLPTFFIVWLSALLLIFFYRRLGADYFAAALISILVLDIVVGLPVLGKYLDYLLDFIIVIPSCIMMYDQWGLFKRDTITISAQSIKTVSIRKNKILYSIFDNGDIIILTEWDSRGDGEVTLRWIPRPEKRRNQMARIVGIDLQANQNPH